MATDMAASLHQGLQQVMISLTGIRIAGDGSIWWVVTALLLVGSIGSRLLIDMWSSRLSSAALILAAIAYLTALAAFFHGINLQSEISQLLLLQGAVLAGHLLLATSMGLHARYVILDAEGGLHKRSPKKKAERKAAKKAAQKNIDQAGQAATDDAAKHDSAASGRTDAADADGGEEESDDERIRRYLGGGRSTARHFPAPVEASDAWSDAVRTGACAEDRHPRGREFCLQFRFRFG